MRRRDKGVASHFTSFGESSRKNPVVHDSRGRDLPLRSRRDKDVVSRPDRRHPEQDLRLFLDTSSSVQTYCPPRPFNYAPWSATLLIRPGLVVHCLYVHVLTVPSFCQASVVYLPLRVSRSPCSRRRCVGTDEACSSRSEWTSRAGAGVSET